MSPMEVAPECTAGFNEIRLKVGLMEKDLINNHELIEKLTEGIEKIQEMNTNLVKMLALHDQKHEIHDKIEEDLDDDVKEIHSRITTESRATQDKVDTLKSEIFKRLDGIHKELLEHIVIRTSNVTTTTTTHSQNPEIAKSLRELDRWKYILIGIIFFLGYLIDHINWKILLQILN